MIGSVRRGQGGVIVWKRDPAEGEVRIYLPVESMEKGREEQGGRCVYIRMIL